MEWEDGRNEKTNPIMKYSNMNISLICRPRYGGALL